MSVNIVKDIDGDYAVEVLGNISENYDLREVTLVAAIDEQEFSVHRLVMMSSSSYFNALLGPNFKEGNEEEVPIADIDGATLKLIIDFCYTGNIEITDANNMQIIAAATAMNFERIEQKFKTFWNDKLCILNCVEIFLLADKYSFPDLRKKSLDFICEHFDEVAIGELLDLEFKYFTELLECDQIYALEENICRRLIQWVDFDAENRAKYAAHLLKLIKLDKIPILFLRDAAQRFAEKCSCSDIVKSEYRRRAASDGKSAEVCRYSAVGEKGIFLASEKIDGIIHVEKYNKISDRWDIFQILKIAAITERTSFGIIFDQSKLFLIGGLKGTTNVATVSTFILDSLQQLVEGKIQTGRGNIMPILFDDHIYIFGGRCGAVVGTCERISLATMTAESIGPMQYGRFDYAATVMNGKIYVAGGKSDQKSYSCSVERYDPIENTWTKVANMNYPRANFGLTELNGMLYAMGHHNCVERYDPIRDVWTAIGSFEDSEKITRAVNLHNEIYILMANGKFGNLKAEPECSLRLLRSVQNASSSFGPILIVD